MSEWPPADRLRSALTRRAEEATIARDAFDRIREKAHEDIASVTPLTARQRPRGIRQLGFVAAAVSLLVVAVLSIVAIDRSNPTDVGNDGPDQLPEDPEPVNPSPTLAVDPATPFDPATSCAALPGGPELYSLTSQGGVEFTYSAPDPATEFPFGATWFQVVDQAGWPIHALEHPLTSAIPDNDFAFGVSAMSSVDLRELLPEIARSGCHPTTNYYIVGEGPTETIDATADAYCTELAGSGFSALILVGPVGEPPPCVVRQPVILASSLAQDASEIEAWTDALDCAPTVATAGAVARWADCRASLTHVRLNGPADPWTTLVDDQSLADFIQAELSS